MLLSQFGFLSFLAVGGVMAIAPDMYRVVVEDFSVVSNDEFLAAITLGKLSPGPNALFVAILGYQIAGLLGALLVVFTMIAPTAIVAFLSIRWREKNKHRLSVQSFSIASAPVVVGLLCSTGFILMNSFSQASELICVLVTAFLVWKTRLPLMVLMVIGAALGYTGAL